MQRKRMRRVAQMVAAVLLAGLAVWGLLPTEYRATRAQDAPAAPADFTEPTTSSPIALSADTNHIWVVNPDDDSVSVIGNLDTDPSVLRTIRVGREPQALAIADTGAAGSYSVYVANAADNSVTVINVAGSTPGNATAVVDKTLTTGAEPWNVVATPNGERVFVANSAQDTITVIRTSDATIVGNITLGDSACNVGDPDRHFQPRGLAVDVGNDYLFVARFLSFTSEGGVQASDLGKEGIVCKIELPADVDTLPSVFTPISLAPQITGFKFDSTVPPDGVLDTDTSAYPNQMQSIVIRGAQAYLPNIASSPTRPLRFNLDTQAFVNRIDDIDTATPADGGALNLHLGARDPEPGKDRLFFANVWAMAFTNQSGAGSAYVVSSGSDLLVKLNVNASGVLTFTGDISTTRYIDLNDRENAATEGDAAGKNPLGIVLRDEAGNNYAYVMNYISRNVSVVDLDTDEVIDTIRTTDLPDDEAAVGNQNQPSDEQLHLGAEMFFSSRGDFVTPAGTTVSTANRLSSEGWQTCSSCHFAGLTDSNIWQFGSGPRKSVPLNATWSPHNPNDQRVLNYSAIFDEVEDFELNIRNVSGPGALAAPLNGSVFNPNQGLIISDTGNINFAPLAVPPLIPIANAGRPQMKVIIPGSANEFDALTALRQWVRFAVRTPNGALTEEELDDADADTTGGIVDADVVAGRRLFFQAGCHECHGGTKWTVSNKDFVSPPAAAEVSTEAPITTTNGGQFLARFIVDIGSFNLGVAGQGNSIGDDVGGVEIDATGRIGLGNDANADGKGKGFNIPGLLGIWALQPYYHNGACESLACVLSNETHRTSGLSTGQADPLTDSGKQAQVVAFLQTLDADTDFPLNLSINQHDLFLDPPVVFSEAQDVVIGANVALFGTRADLQNLMDDLALTEIKVTFTTPAGDVVGSFTPDDFPQDFGQAVVTATFDMPNVSQVTQQIAVAVDPDEDLPESNENDNEARRTIGVRAAPSDTTPPEVSSVLISDDDPFNDNDLIAQSRDAKVKFVASDNTEVTSFCIVRYSFDTATRRWVEESCTFAPVPEPETGTDDTYIVDTRLPPFTGGAYAFVHVADGAGNVSRFPGFDFINFVTDTTIPITRNDVDIFRVDLNAGETLTLTVIVRSGDVDAAAFKGFKSPATATRVALSANNGTTTEVVSATGPGDFQFEIVGVVNSRYRIVVTQGVGVAASPAQVDIVTGSALNAILIGGPPAEQTAIDGPDAEEDSNDVSLPVILK